jgi:hypothetical protein
MTKAEFLTLMSNFSVIRPGMYALPDFVLGAVFDAWEEAGSLEPLEAYERPVHFLYDADEDQRNRRHQYPGYRRYAAVELESIEAFLAGEGYWQPGEIFEPAELGEITAYLALCWERERMHAERDRMRASYAGRRAAANIAISNAKLRREIFHRDGYRCRRCRGRDRLSIDHIIAVAMGGTDDPENLQTLCVLCNSSKGARQ